MSKKDFRFAFTKSLPVMFGYIVLGIAWGILMNKAGFNALWPLIISTVVYTGAFQFVLVPFLAAGTSLPTVIVTCLAMSSRQIFYGVSFIEQFRKMGRRYFYMVFSLTDETYGLFTSTDFPEDINKENSMFAIAVLCHSYWITGSVLGAVIGMLLPFSLEGIDFSMTAMFVTMLIDQWRKPGGRKPALLGLISTAVSLAVLGPEKFLLPALIFMTAVLIIVNRTGGARHDN